MMIERVDDFKWIEGTEGDFKIEGVSEMHLRVSVVGRE